MNLGKLLAAGNSVVKGNGAVEYRHSKQAALPKFVSPKNPFANPSKPSKAMAAAPVKNNPTPTAGKTQPLPTICAPPKPLSGWASKLKPSSLWGSQTPTEQKVLPEIQAELSLDTVKVVHNDLSDADVEVVPIKSRPAASETNAESIEKKSWAILGKRLLKATAL